MNKLFLKSVVLTLAVILTIPESMARRVGGGRSIGRQSSALRQRALPAPAPRPQPPAGAAPANGSASAMRQAPTPLPAPAPLSPVQPLHRQAATPWGGMMGGALLGLGLGSLMSSGNRDTIPPAQNANGGGVGQNNGVNSEGGITNPNAATSSAQTQQSGLGSLFLPAILALIAFFVFRKMRAKAARKQENVGI